MGRFMYGDTAHEAFTVDDRTLAHLELAISAQLRLGGAFPLTLEGEQVPAGRGRHVLWLHPAIPLQFRYQIDRRQIQINPRWVAAMTAVAGSEHGLRIVPEPTHVEPKEREPIYG